MRFRVYAEVEIENEEREKHHQKEKHERPDSTVSVVYVDDLPFDFQV